MAEKVVLNYVEAIKELVLIQNSNAEYVVNELGRSDIKTIFTNLKSKVSYLPATPLMQQISTALENVEENKTFFDEVVFLCRVSSIIHGSFRKDSNLLQSFLLRFEKYTTVTDGKTSRVDHEVAYKLAQELYKHVRMLYGPDSTEGKNILQMIIKNPLATTFDYSMCHQYAPKAMQADIFANMEKCARKEISGILNAPVPDVHKVKFIIENVRNCAARTYGQHSDEYRNIMAEYNEANFLTPNAAKYISSMPDVYSRQIDVLKQEKTKIARELESEKRQVAELKAEIDALKSDKIGLKKTIATHEEQIVALLCSIDATRPSLLSRRVNAAKRQAESIKHELGIKSK